MSGAGPGGGSPGPAGRRRPEAASGRESAPAPWAVVPEFGELSVISFIHPLTRSFVRSFFRLCVSSHLQFSNIRPWALSAPCPLGTAAANALERAAGLGFLLELCSSVCEAGLSAELKTA